MRLNFFDLVNSFKEQPETDEPGNSQDDSEQKHIFYFSDSVIMIQQPANQHQ